MEPEALYSAFLVILLVTWNVGRRRMGTAGKISEIEVTENSLFY